MMSVVAPALSADDVRGRFDDVPPATVGLDVPEAFVEPTAQTTTDAR
jgi:hypothetical protein